VERIIAYGWSFSLTAEMVLPKTYDLNANYLKFPWTCHLSA